MVVDRLKAKGLPLIPCSHTRGLQLENIINGIVDSHSVMCTQPSQQQPGPSQQQGIPLQDVNDDDNLEVQRASQLIEELANSFAKSHDISSNKSTITLQSSVKKSIPRKRPIGRENLETRMTSPKRARSRGGPLIHKCDKCGKAFANPQERDRHGVAHSQVRPYKCEKCDYCAKSKREVTKHFQRVHLHRYPHHCSICNKGYSSKNKVIAHEKKHLNIDDKDRPFVCKHCGKGFFVAWELNSHLPVHEKDMRFKCDLCPFTSGTRRTRWRHLNETHQVLATRKTSTCLVCNKELHEYHLLIAHMKENHEIAGVKCEECGAMLPSDKRLKQHMEKEHLPDPECTICKESFENKTLLTAHMKKNHWVGIECKECGDMFKTDKQLHAHILKKLTRWPEKLKKVLEMGQTIKEPVTIPEKRRYQRRVAKAQSSKEGSSVKTSSQKGAIKPGAKKSKIPLKKRTGRPVGRPRKTPEKGTGRPVGRPRKTHEKSGAKKSGAKRKKKAKKAKKKKADKTVNQGQADKVASTDKSSKADKNQIDEGERTPSSTTKQTETGGSKISSAEKEDVSVQEKGLDNTSNPSSAEEDKTKKGVTIYAKSSDNVAQMIAEGKVKVSLTIPGVSKSSMVTLLLPTKDQSASSTGGPASSKTPSVTENSTGSDDKNSTPAGAESSDQSDMSSYVATVTEPKSGTDTVTTSSNVSSDDGKQEKATEGQRSGSQQTESDNTTQKSQSPGTTPATDETQEEAAEGQRSGTQQVESDTLAESTLSTLSPDTTQEEAAEGQRSGTQVESDTLAESTSSTLSPDTMQEETTEPEGQSEK